jgi:ketosteroid isomerase-like protein/hemerythrin-like domain-containing protein
VHNRIAMRRSEALAPLSRDHHVALVVAAALQRAGQDDLEAAVARFVEFLTGHELSHFAVEEAVLLPAVPDDDTGQALAARVLEDHAFLRDALKRLRHSPVAADLDLVHAVGVRLREHVRMEERELFPYLERLLDPATLDDIGSRLAHESGGDPAEVVRGFLDAFIARDIERLLALADPEVELHPLRLTGVPGYHGHDGLRRWLDDLEQRASDVSFTVDEVRALDDTRVLARVQVRPGDEEPSVRAIFIIAAGRVREVHVYFSDEDLLAHVGHL